MKLVNKVLIGCFAALASIGIVAIPTTAIYINKQKSIIKNDYNLYLDEPSFRSKMLNVSNKNEINVMFVGTNANKTIANNSNIPLNSIDSVLVTEGTPTENDYYSLNITIKLVNPYYFLNTDSNTLTLENVETRIPVDSTIVSTDNLYYEISADGTLTGLTDFGKQQPILTIPETVTQIQASEDPKVNVFSSSTKLKQVILPSTIKSLPKYSFSNSTIESIYIPDNILSLGYGVFESCKNLKTVIFGPNCALKSLGGAVFRNTALTSITLPATITALNSGTFQNIKTLSSIVMLASTMTFNTEKVFFGSSESAKFIVQNETIKTNLQKQILKTVNSSNTTIPVDSIFVIDSSTSTSPPTSLNLKKYL